MDIRPTHAARYTRVCNPVKDLNWATSYSRNGSINPHTHSLFHRIRMATTTASSTTSSSSSESSEGSEGKSRRTKWIYRNRLNLVDASRIDGMAYQAAHRTIPVEFLLPRALNIQRNHRNLCSQDRGRLQLDGER